MSRTVFFSRANPFAMRQVDEQRPDKYKRGHLDESWQKHLVLSHQSDKEYIIKYERANRFRFPFCTTQSSTASISLKIINCDGITVTTITTNSTAAITGRLTDDGTQLHSFVYKATNLSAVTSDGIYYILLTVDYGGGNVDQFISHKISIKDTHEGTMLIEYRHSGNTQGLFFEQLPATYSLLVEAYIGRLISKNVSTAFEGQDYGLTQLDSKTYREWPLYVGQTGEGIADWTKDLLGHILDMDTVLFDGKQYRRAVSANFEDEGSEISPLYATRINLREPENPQGQSYTNGAIDIYTIPSYPFAVKDVYLYTLSGGTRIGGTVVITGAPGHATFVTTLNTAAANADFTGTFAVNAGILQYTPGAGERITSGIGIIATTALSYNTVQTAGITSTTPLLRGAFGVIEWGDGNVEDAVSGYLTYDTFTHTYGTSATFTVKIWGDLVGLNLVDSHRTTLGGTPSGLMEELSVSTGTSTSNTLDFSYLSPVQSTLKKLWITNAGLTAAPNFNSYNFPLLKNINFSGNAFSTNVVSAFMYDVWYNASNHGTMVNIIKGGTFSIAGQSPAAGLNGTGVTYKSRLQSSFPIPFNWTVNN